MQRKPPHGPADLNVEMKTGDLAPERRWRLLTRVAIYVCIALWVVIALFVGVP